MKSAAVILAALAAAATLSACASSPAPKPSPSPTHATAAAFTGCSKLAASPLPLAAYDLLVIGEANRLAAGGSLSKAQERHARAVVAAGVAASCPKFSYLAKQDG